MSSESFDEELVEFRVARLASSRPKLYPLRFSFVRSFVANYNDYVEHASAEDAKRLYLQVGRNPKKFVFMPSLQRESLPGLGDVFLGRIGYLYTSRYPNIFDMEKIEIEGLMLPRSKSLMYLAHFAVFGYNGDAYVIYEMNNNSARIGKFTEYLCNACKNIDSLNNVCKGICPIKYEFVTKNPRSILRRYRYVTRITVSGTLRASKIFQSMTGVNLLDSLLRRNTRRFTIELSGAGEPLGFTIDDIIELLDIYEENMRENILAKFTVTVKKSRGEPGVSINLLKYSLSFKKQVPRERDPAGHELGSLKTEEAYKTLKELVIEAHEILKSQAVEEPREEERRGLLRWLPFPRR